jgi:hypothetical protein
MGVSSGGRGPAVIMTIVCGVDRLAVIVTVVGGVDRLAVVVTVVGGVDRLAVIVTVVCGVDRLAVVVTIVCGVDRLAVVVTITGSMNLFSWAQRLDEFFEVSALSVYDDAGADHLHEDGLATGDEHGAQERGIHLVLAAAHAFEGAGDCDIKGTEAQETQAGQGADFIGRERGLIHLASPAVDIRFYSAAIAREYADVAFGFLACFAYDQIDIARAGNGGFAPTVGRIPREG